MSTLKGKVVFITGASAGIGAETAKEYAKHGCKLALTGRNEHGLEAVSKQCQDLGSRREDLLILLGDVTDHKQMTNIVQQITERFSRIDILVNNAGIVAQGYAQETSLETWDTVMNTNLRSVFCLTKLVIPHLIRTKGCVINVSSVNGLRPAPDVVAYSVSKAALDQLTKCLALELAQHGVRVNSVNPAITRTRLAAKSGMSDDQYNRFMEYQKSTHPLGRVAEPEEVAKAITWLSCDDASFVTGVLLPLDGGRTILPPPSDPNPV